MEWLTEPFAESFMVRALVAGALAALVTSLVGTWVVIRGLSFMGDALAHGVLPGIALGVLVGFDLTLGAVLSAIVMIAGINLVHRHSRLGEDAGIGLLFVGMLATGVVIISRSPTYSGSLSDILFGDALGVTATDIVSLGVAAVVAVGATVVLYRPLLALSFNAEKAEALGMRPGATHVALLALVTMAVVASFQTVGTLLVFGLLVAPPSAAALVARRVPVMMTTAAGLGIASVVGGLLVSWHAGTAASATIAALAVGVFFLILTGRAVAGATR